MKAETASIWVVERRRQQMVQVYDQSEQHDQPGPFPLLRKGQPSRQPWDKDVENKVKSGAGHGKSGCYIKTRDIRIHPSHGVVLQPEEIYRCSVGDE